MLPVNRFVDFIEQNELFTKGSKILAAVSGGMDSVLMVHLLKSAGYNFGIAHCNFQLRDAESDGDEQFCRQLARQLDVPFHHTRFNTLQYAGANKVSTQMAARNLRYQWFRQLLVQHGYAAIALAHHQNDTIETILLNLTRGTGIAGLHGILPKNADLVRPLLFLTRNEIQQITDQNRIEYREDSSNASTKYARNKIRHEVIPKLKELNPSLEQTFENNLRHFRDLEVLLDERVAALKQTLLISEGDEIHIQLDDLKKLHPKHLLIFKLLQDYGFNETVADDLIASLNKHSGRTFESESYRMIVDREKVILVKINKEQAEEIQLDIDTREVSFNGYLLTVLHDDSPLIIKDNPLAVSVDADLLIYPLTLRCWQQGDYFYPIGMKGRKKLSDFFISQKVPLHQKDNIPLIINGNGEVVWIGGHRLDDRYKITPNTKKVTIFELNKISI